MGKETKLSKRIATGEVYDSKEAAAEADLEPFRCYHENGHHIATSTFNWKTNNPRGSSNSVSCSNNITVAPRESINWTRLWKTVTLEAAEAYIKLFRWYYENEMD